MKKRITLVLALAAFAASAQYNTTYDVNGNGDFLKPSFVINGPQGITTALSIAYDAPGVPRTDYFVLTKSRCDGRVMYNTRIFNTNVPRDGMTHVEALINTDDGGTMIAGYHYDDVNQLIQQPMLVKVDANGNLMWKRIYYVNQKDAIDLQINKISLCRVVDDAPVENYFIVATSDSDRDPGNSVVTCVIKVDNVGTPMIMNKYYFGANYITSREYPGDIEFSPRNRTYMITGYRMDIAPDGTQQDRMFFFGIDRNANPITVMRTLESKSRPVDQDMIYDANRNEFAVAFTHENSAYVPGINSLIGFVKVDPFTNVIAGSPKAYWHGNGTEHNGRSISACANGDYAIGAGIFDPNMNVNNPSLLKINTFGAITLNLTRYNILDDVYFGHHATSATCAGAEAYALVSEQNRWLRVIKTDINGRVCGSRAYQTRLLDYVPDESKYDINYKRVGFFKDYGPVQKFLDPQTRNCTGTGSSYRLAVATGIAQLDNDGSTVAMYPTILSADNARLTMVNNSGAALKVELHNIAGQLIYSNANVADGTSEVQLNSNGSLSEGIYLLKAYDDKGTLTSTTKLLITK